MAKQKFKITEAERKELVKAYQGSQDATTRIRYQAVRLHKEGYAKKVGLCPVILSGATLPGTVRQGVSLRAT